MRTYKRTEKDGSVTTVTTTAPLPEMDQLCETVELYVSRNVKWEDRDAMYRMAWFLGMNGQTKVCEAIMRHKTTTPTW